MPLVSTVAIFELDDVQRVCGVRVFLKTAHRRFRNQFLASFWSTERDFGRQDFEFIGGQQRRGRQVYFNFDVGQMRIVLVLLTTFRTCFRPYKRDGVRRNRISS